MANFNYKFFKYLSVYEYWCNKLLGLGPYTYNRSKRCFERSVCLEVYTFFAGCFIVYSNYTSNTKLLAHVDQKFTLLSPKPLIKIIRLLDLTNIAVNYITVLVLNRKTIDARNKLRSCDFEIILFSKMKYVNLSYNYFLIFVLKEIILKWVIFVWNMVGLRVVSNYQLTYIDVIFNRLALFITYLVSSHFIASLMDSIHLYDIINGELVQIINELNQKPELIRTVRLLDFCDTIDRLHNYHRKITRCFKAVITVCAVPMLMQISFLFVNVVIFSYFELAFIILGYTMRITAENLLLLSICAVFNMFAGVIQLFSYSILSARVVRKSRKAAQLLSSFPKLGVVDERLVRTVESFSLSLEQNKFEISICGLFVVNYELMYAMAASMTSYLIILVQYQLEFSKTA